MISKAQKHAHKAAAGVACGHLRPGHRSAVASAVAAAFLGLTSPLAAQAPLSAIDWLSDPLPLAETPLLPLSPPEDEGEAGDRTILTRTLDAPRPESVGLYPAARVGLAPGLWGPSSNRELAELIRILPADMLPALRDLAYRLLLAEFDAPAADPAPGRDWGEVFVLARVDALISFGAIDQASALLDALDPLSPALLARRFDLRLLLGEDEGACADLARAVAGAANLSLPDPLAAGRLQAASVFCQARAGDWLGAEAQLASAGAMDGLSPTYRELLTRFMDAEDAYAGVGSENAITPPRISPLAWRLREALGDPVRTQGLPVAFAHADLRGTAGWRAQIEAAERLVRSGAVSPNRLLGLYTERRAAASGGIWERVDRVQRLDAALASGRPDEIGEALMAAWPQFQDAELEIAFAALFATPLLASGLDGPAGELALEVGLLSAEYERVALELGSDAGSPRLMGLIAVARGLPSEAEIRSGTDAEAAVLAVFATPSPVPDPVQRRLDDGRVGEELLRALIRAGASGDPRMLAEALTLLRHVGLEDVARRTALQALLLERRG